jgi:hypothetical protein
VVSQLGVAVLWIPHLASTTSWGGVDAGENLAPAPVIAGGDNMHASTHSCCSRGNLDLGIMDQTIATQSASLSLMRSLFFGAYARWSR